MNTDLEQEERVRTGVVARAGEEEALAAEEAPQAVAEEEAVERRRAAQVQRCGVHGDGAELEREADGVVGEAWRRRRRRS
jgi:hypothetical protein